MSFWSEKILPRVIDRVCGSEKIAAERARWVPRAEGDVLEIGVGSGLNLPHYDPTRVRRVVGVDPSPALLALAAARRTRLARVPELVCAPAEVLPLPDACFDSAVVTYTLCSVRDPGAVLREVRRVLRRGAPLLFIEHGLAPDRGPSTVQRVVTPLWRRAAGNCHLDRDIARELDRAELAVVELEAGYGQGPRWIDFTYQGIARA